MMLLNLLMKLKEQLTNIVNDVLADNSTRKIGEVEGDKEK